MIYRPTTESYELYLVSMNTCELANELDYLCKYAQKKVDQDKFVLWKFTDLVYQTLVNSANKYYLKSFGYSFGVGDRFTASVQIANNIFCECLNGYYR